VKIDEEIVAAYAAGEAVDEISRRLGVPASEVVRVVEQETGIVPPAARQQVGIGRRRMTATGVVGIVLIVAGGVGPCGGGILWLAVYYASAQLYPVEGLGYGNVAVGLIGMAVGVAMAAAGAVLLLTDRRRRQR
jgi:hypothetical protein